jgi:hypothetical protein
MITSIDVVHGIMFLGCLLSYTVLNALGHSEPTSNEALLGLASFTAGSYVRSKT